MKNAAALWLLFAVCCLPGDRPVRTEEPFPVHPFWTLAQLPDGPAPHERLLPPAGSAVLVAPGYLLASVYGMGEVADDFGLDPTVFVLSAEGGDDGAWHVCRYVDRDHGLDLALIRCEGLPGRPVRLQRGSAAPVRVVGIPAAEAASVLVVRRESAFVACSAVPSWLRRQTAEDLGLPPPGALCGAGPVTDLAGGALLDGSGELAGLQVAAPGRTQLIGPDGAQVREFLDTYFASWGRDVRPRPEY